MSNLIYGAHGAIYDAPQAAARPKLRFVSPDSSILKSYRPLTTGIDLDWKIDGQPAIERFARDQERRDYVLVKAFDGSAEVWVHEKHLVKTDPEI
jgi:hypothetical protein